MSGNSTFFQSDPNTSATNQAIYSRIVGSTAQVSAGTATDTTIAAAIAAASVGQSIRILSGTFTENVSVSKQLSFEGCGRGSVVSGTWTFATSSDYSSLTKIKMTGNCTVNSGVVGIQVDKVWFPNTASFADNSGNTISNILQGIQET